MIGKLCALFAIIAVAASRAVETINGTSACTSCTPKIGTSVAFPLARAEPRPPASPGASSAHPAFLGTWSFGGNHATWVDALASEPFPLEARAQLCAMGCGIRGSISSQCPAGRAAG